MDWDCVHSTDEEHWEPSSTLKYVLLSANRATQFFTVIGPSTSSYLLYTPHLLHSAPANQFLELIEVKMLPIQHELSDNSDSYVCIFFFAITPYLLETFIQHLFRVTIHLFVKSVSSYAHACEEIARLSYLLQRFLQFLHQLIKM